MKVHAFALIALVMLALGVSATTNPANNVRPVTFDVAVTDKNGNPVGGLNKSNFRVFEDNVEQTLTSVQSGKKLVAMVIVAEYSDAFPYYIADVIRPAEGMVQSLQPEDWMALVSFDTQGKIDVDFTHDKTAMLASLRRLQMPNSHEVALHDSLYFVLDQLSQIEDLKEAKKAIFLLASGRDTVSSKRSLEDVLKKATSSGVMIYAVGTAQPPSTISYSSQYPRDQYPFGPEPFDWSGHTLRTLTETTGGLAFFPQFEGQQRAIYPTVNADLRHPYTLRFVSSSNKPAGKLRKLRVEITGSDIDQNGKPDKLQVRNQEGHYGF